MTQGDAGAKSAKGVRERGRDGGGGTPWGERGDSKRESVGARERERERKSERASESEREEEHSTVFLF